MKKFGYAILCVCLLMTLFAAVASAASATAILRTNETKATAGPIGSGPYCSYTASNDISSRAASRNIVKADGAIKADFPLAKGSGAVGNARVGSPGSTWTVEVTVDGGGSGNYSTCTIYDFLQ